jgi:hypothetical protein
LVIALTHHRRTAVFEQDLIKVCPECGGEFRPDVERCADCEVPLVHPEEIAARNARELPVVAGLVAACTDSIAEVRELAAELDKRGVRYRIDRRRARPDGLLTLYVQWKDREAAAEVVEDLGLGEEADGGEEEQVVGVRERPSYKICPDCGGEYRLDIERCADCGIVLVFPGQAPALREDEEEPVRAAPELLHTLPYPGPLHELPPSDDLVCICCRPIDTLQSLSLLLNEAGIAHRIDPAPFYPTLFSDDTHPIDDYKRPPRKAYRPTVVCGCLYTLPPDGDAAAAVDDGMWKSAFDDPNLERDLTVCPACETPHARDANQCTHCGLVLGTKDVLLDRTCQRCGAIVGLPVSRCPSCDAALPRA